MPITLEWANTEQTILIQTFTGKWTWEEFKQSNSVRAVEMMQSVPHEVHLIGNFLPSGNLPLGGAINHGHKVMSVYPPNWGILVIVTDKQFLFTLTDTFRKLFRNLGKKTYTAKTIAEAHAVIAQYHPKAQIK